MSTVAAEMVEAHEYYGDELVRRATLERRNYERKSVAIHAKVTVMGMSVLPGHTVDMSRAGASITVPFELAHGQACLIDLELGSVRADQHLPHTWGSALLRADGQRPLPGGCAIWRNGCGDQRVHRGNIENARLNSKNSSEAHRIPSELKKSRLSSRNPAWPCRRSPSEERRSRHPHSCESRRCARPPANPPVAG